MSPSCLYPYWVNGKSQDCSVCFNVFSDYQHICCSLFFISGNFYFSFASPILTYISTYHTQKQKKITITLSLHWKRKNASFFGTVMGNLCSESQNGNENFPGENALYQEPMTHRLLLIPHALRRSIVNLDKNTTLGTPLCKNAGYAPVIRILRLKLRNFKNIKNEPQAEILKNL